MFYRIVVCICLCFPLAALSGCVPFLQKSSSSSFTSRTKTEFSARKEPARLVQKEEAGSITVEHGYVPVGEVKVSLKQNRCWSGECKEVKHSSTVEEILGKEAAKVGGDVVVVTNRRPYSETLSKDGDCREWGDVEVTEWVCDTEYYTNAMGNMDSRQVNCRNEYVTRRGCVDREKIYGSDNFVELTGEVFRQDREHATRTAQLGTIKQVLQNGTGAQMRALIDQGMKVSKPLIDGTVPVLMVLEADNANALRVMLENGISTNMKIEDRTLLFYAVGEGKTACAPVLIAAGANVNAKDATGWPPLFEAAMQGNTLLVKRLLDAGARVDIRSKYDLGPFYYAGWGGKREIVDLLLKHGGDIRRGLPMHGAIAKGHVELLQYLLSLGLDVDKVNPYDNTALIDACIMGNRAAAQILIKAGADLDHKGEEHTARALVNTLWPDML